MSLIFDDVIGLAFDSESRELSVREPKETKGDVAEVGLLDVFFCGDIDESLAAASTASGDSASAMDDRLRWRSSDWNVIVRPSLRSKDPVRLINPSV